MKACTEFDLKFWESEDQILIRKTVKTGKLKCLAVLIDRHVKDPKCHFDQSDSSFKKCTVKTKLNFTKIKNVAGNFYKIKNPVYYFDPRLPVS